MRRRNTYEDEILRAKKALVETNSELEQAQSALQATNTQLGAFNERLETEVQKRTTELQAALNDLSAFSYAVAHDLRAPLRAVVSTSEILLDEAPHVLGEDHKAMLVRQSYNARKLAHLIDGLLRFSRLEQRPVERQEVDITATAWDAVGALDPNEVSPAIQIAPDLQAMCDGNAFRIVLYNLIDNAVKYSPRGGNVRVGSMASESDQVFFVSDEGIGFDVASLDKIFLPFERLHHDSEYRGTGIGLAIAKRIVERHGGKIWAESTPGKGSTFFFTVSPGPKITQE
jgi:signal transduction histidine kinase